MRSTNRLKFLIRADFSFNGSILVRFRDRRAPPTSQHGGDREQINTAGWEDGDVGASEVDRPRLQSASRATPDSGLTSAPPVTECESVHRRKQEAPGTRSGTNETVGRTQESVRPDFKGGPVRSAVPKVLHYFTRSPQATLLVRTGAGSTPSMSSFWSTAMKDATGFSSCQLRGPLEIVFR